MGLADVRSRGPRGRVLKFIRENGRCPFDLFHKTCLPGFHKKFDSQFNAICQLGSDYRNAERFKALTGDGKPLWEFKQFDHRLYAIREVVEDQTTVVLLGGWQKDKNGRSLEEAREIAKAQTLRDEYQRLHGGPS